MDRTDQAATSPRRRAPTSRNGVHLLKSEDAGLPPDTRMYSLPPPRGPPLIDLPRPSPRDSGARPWPARCSVSLIRALMMTLPLSRARANLTQVNGHSAPA